VLLGGRPIRDLESRNATEFRKIVGRQLGVKADGVRSDEKIHRADWCAHSFEFATDDAVMTWSIDRVEVESLESPERLSRRLHLSGIVRRAARAILQFGDRNRGNAYSIAASKTLPAFQSDGVGAAFHGWRRAPFPTAN
jgi:hypothetical protein